MKGAIQDGGRSMEEQDTAYYNTPELERLTAWARFKEAVCQDRLTGAGDIVLSNKAVQTEYGDTAVFRDLRYGPE
jgi:hypothetical protein